MHLIITTTEGLKKLYQIANYSSIIITDVKQEEDDLYYVKYKEE